MQVVQLSIEVYRFFRSVSKASIEARSTYKKIKRLHDVIQNVELVLRRRETEANSQPSMKDEARVEASIRVSLDACRRILLDMGREIQRLTGEESLSLASRARESLRYTVCTSRKIQENGQSLDTHLQTLRTSLQLLQCFEHFRTRNQMDMHHDELLARLSRLERAMGRAGSHLTLLSQRNHSSHAQPSNGCTSIESNVDTTLTNHDPELDLTGIRTLRQTLHVAKSVRSEYSTWEPDAESIRRVRHSDSSDLMFEHDSSSDEDSESDQELSGDEAGRRPSTTTAVNESLHPDVRGLSLKTPLPMLISLIETFQMKAQKEFKEGNFQRAETNQIEAITHLEEREASYGVPFDNRVHMQQFLAEIYIKQHSLEQALSIMLELANSGSDPTNEEDQAVLLVQAKQHQLLAEIYHKRYLSNDNTADLQRAEKLARSAFNKITLSAPSDPQSLVSCQLLVHVYQAQRRTGLAEFFQSLTTSGSHPSPTSPVVPPQIEAPQPSQAEIIIDVNAKDSNGRTPLISAIRSRDEPRIQAVLDLNPDIHLRCTKDRTPLMHAIEVEFEIAVRRLVDRGAEVNAKTPGQSTALHQAASRGSTEMIELLISLDATIECRNRDGATPLLKASEANQSTTVSILLRKGADVSVKDNSGWGVLHYAVHSSAVDVLRVLFFQNEGARIDPNSRCPAGKTALHFAAENASLEPAEILLDHGADIEARDFSMRKRTPLHLAVSKTPTEQRITFVRFLLSRHTYVDMSQLSPQERRRYGHLLHGPSLARSDSGFSSLGSSNSNNSVISFSRRVFSGRRRG